MNSESIPIRYRYCTKSRFNPMPFHSHERYEIFYFHEGRGNYVIGDKIYALQPGNLIIMNGMTLHCSNIDTRYDYYRTTLHFDPNYTREIAAPLRTLNLLRPFDEIGNLRIQLDREHKSEFEQLLQRMQTYYNQKDPLSNSRFLLAFLDLLHQVYQFCERSLEEKTEYSTAKEHHVLNMISYVDKHYHEDITLEQMEKDLHLSKTYMSKIFKEVTGLTLFKFVYQRRINQAKVLFLLENRSVTDTCFQVGFKHLAHFSRLFKEFERCTPDQFRKASQCK